MNRLPWIVLFSFGCNLGLSVNNADKDAVEGACEDDLDRFETYAWRPAFGSECVLCHVEGGAAGETGLVFKSQNMDGWRQHNLEAAKAMALQTFEGQPLMLIKPTNQHPAGHGGGEVLEEGSPAYLAISDFIDRVTGVAEDCDPKEDGTYTDCAEDIVGARRLRRLTHEEYKATVHDLVGVDFDAALDFAADDVVGGFKNNAGVLDVSGLLADQYRLAAEEIAGQADVNALVTCNPAEVGMGNCAYDFIWDFGQRAYRRPLTMTEVDAYHNLWRTVTEEDGFDEGIRWVITGMLQAPGFLYRSELGAASGGDFTLTDYEIATELSYLIWGSMPDDTLFSLAAAGQLQDPDVRAEQALRMLADERASDNYAHFVREWLELDKLMFVTRDDALTRDIREAMLGETDRLARYTLESGGDLSDLLLSETTFMTDELAAFYGLPVGDDPADSEGFRPISLQDNPYRGLLTQGSILATYALPEYTSPIHRGLLVRERMLCNDLPDPPANLDTSPPDVDPNQSTRERFAQHSEDPACKDCHNRIDGIGFSFEHFDGLGRWREMDGIHPVDASGEIMKSEQTDATFYGVEELAEVLAGSNEVRDCYNSMWLTHTLGTNEAREVNCLTGWMGENSEPSLQGRLLTLIASNTFVSRAGESSEQSGPMGDPEQELPWISEDEDVDIDVPDYEVEIITASQWGTGYCKDVIVRNTSTAPVTWHVDIDVSGTINNHWVCNIDQTSGTVRFTGDTWNATLDPGAETKFGFCVNF